MSYAARHPDDPRMVVQALVHALRPPDRYPPRLATLSAEQEAVVCAFLEHMATSVAWEALQDDAQQALEEWWWPNPRSRPTPADIAALRSAPVSYRDAGDRSYRLELPHALAGSGVRDIPEEQRRVETRAACSAATRIPRWP
jgi:hypothetical protein